MIKLEIKKQNGEVYWKEHFKNQSEAEKWLAEEKTRPYWDQSFTHEIIDDTTQELAKKEQLEQLEQVEKSERKAKRKEAKDLLKKKDMTIDDLKKVVQQLIDEKD